MLVIIQILNIIMPVLYGLLLTFYLIDFYWEKSIKAGYNRTFLFATIALHFVYMIMRAFEFSHFLITTKYELFTSIAFTIATAYIIIEILTKVKITGFIILVFPFLFQLISSLFIRDIYQVKEVLRNPLLGLHVISALLGVSAFIISAVYGFLFVILYNRIKRRKYGVFFDKLPSLEVMEKMSFISLFVGFIILTVSIIIGAIWLPVAFPEFSHIDPKLISSIFIWLVYALGITMKIKFKWYGKKLIILSIFGMFIVIISMMIPYVFKSSFHNFL